MPPPESTSNSTPIVIAMPPAENSVQNQQNVTQPPPYTETEAK